VPGDDLIILKFGGSVLTDQTALPSVVHEIYRWRRDGWRVVAVVSALAGRTDALLAECGELARSGLADHAVAAHVCNGELSCASGVGLLLERAGVSASTLSPAALRLHAGGPPLDADPAAIDVDPVRAALDRDGVVVIPGFTGVAPDGRAVVFGRGGSDLTALFLADALGAARCRLIKDVDGLYERDPRAVHPPPRRYAQASWADALAADGSILQLKAVRFAQRRALSFELGCLNGTEPTLIGARPRTFADGAPLARPTVALLGLGVVGGGVLKLLRASGAFELLSITVRRADRPRDASIPRDLIATDAIEAASCGADIVIEAIGGLEPARTAVDVALSNGSHVVTANKRLLADSGASLAATARENGVCLAGSASVGGGAPILERAASRPGARIRQVAAVLNGTTNFVLNRVDRGEAFEEAVAEAQRLGFAEADPSRDLSGRDAADKLAVLSSALGLGRLRVAAIEISPMDAAEFDQARRSSAPGDVIRHVARLRVGPSGETRAEVRLRPVPVDSALGEARDEQNVAVFEWADGDVEVVRGRGAGRRPTAEAVMADVLALARGDGASVFPHPPAAQEGRPLHA